MVFPGPVTGGGNQVWGQEDGLGGFLLEKVREQSPPPRESQYSHVSTLAILVK